MRAQCSRGHSRSSACVFGVCSCVMGSVRARVRAGVRNLGGYTGNLTIMSLRGHIRQTQGKPQDSSHARRMTYSTMRSTGHAVGVSGPCAVSTSTLEHKSNPQNTRRSGNISARARSRHHPIRRSRTAPCCTAPAPALGERAATAHWASSRSCTQDGQPPSRALGSWHRRTCPLA